MGAIIRRLASAAFVAALVTVTGIAAADADARRNAPSQTELRVPSREAVTPPKFVGGCRGPALSEEARMSRQTMRVRVRVVVGPDGVPTRPQMEQSHPLVPDASVIECALGQRFAPARLPDGTAVPYPLRRRFTFVAAAEPPAPLPVVEQGE